MYWRPSNVGKQTETSTASYLQTVVAASGYKVLPSSQLLNFKQGAMLSGSQV
jgi:hypothetical protein